MAISQYLTSSLLLVLALWADFGHSSRLHLADVNGKQLLHRSNSSFYGGVALWVTITDSTDVCPSDLQTVNRVMMQHVVLKEHIAKTMIIIAAP
jgi:hypothetical protein